MSNPITPFKCNKFSDKVWTSAILGVDHLNADFVDKAPSCSQWNQWSTIMAEAEWTLNRLDAQSECDNLEAGVHDAIVERVALVKDFQKRFSAFIAH